MRWTEEKANEWRQSIGRVIGCNYLPATAVNSTEMWQKDTFDPETIKKELMLAASTGYNSVRVFLQFIVWEAERESFMKNFEDFLKIADLSGISVMPVLFDDCAFAEKEPYLGKQDDPKHGVHNSGWTPSPGPAIADDPSKQEELRAYVTDIVGTFKDDRRIIVWDLYNEPCNSKRGEKSLPLLKNAFKWAREANPRQPLTTGLWNIVGDYEFPAHEYIFAELSDVISYHDYLPLGQSVDRHGVLKKYNRPLFCTEWMYRPGNNTFESHLPFFMEENAGIYNWGLVAGKTQTNLYNGETVCDKQAGIHGDAAEPHPVVWQHDIFYPDFTPYSEAEIAILRQCAQRKEHV